MRLPRSEGIAFCVAFLVESLSIIIGNLLVIVVFTSSRRLRKRKYYFLVNLAFSDLMIGIVGVSVSVYRVADFFDLWQLTLSDSATFVLYFAQDIFCFSSLVNLATISFERMHATLWPMRHRAVTTRLYRALVVLVWTTSACFAAFLAYTRTYVLWDPTLNLLFLLIVSGILLTISISYMSIWTKFKFGQRPSNTANVSQERKLTVSLFIVTAVSLITGLPYPVLLLVFPKRSSGISLNNFGYLYNSFTLLFFLNSLANPIVYILRMPQFRQAVSRFLHRKRRSERRANVTEMTTRGSENCGPNASHCRIEWKSSRTSHCFHCCSVNTDLQPCRFFHSLLSFPYKENRKCPNI